eukprot:TRINITY_DN13967_c0_g3_i4.p1 TRINITY_DN13967_c0_g3~~TRINITY_DN13967_c0_g3_i4.p1  ORF type:complete len:404 (+),score=78.10 TRINITY_DN13967_c0_g3_i4:350-1561(+)
MTSLHTSYPARVYVTLVDSLGDLLYGEQSCGEELAARVVSGERVVKSFVTTFENKSTSHQQLVEEIDLQYAGPLYVIIIFCEGSWNASSSAVLWLYGSLAFRNVDGFLNSGDLKFIPIYSVFLALCVLLLVFYGMLMCHKKPQIGRIHYYYYSLIVLQGVEVCLILVNAVIENRRGEEFKELNSGFALLFSLRCALAFVLLCLFSTGIRYKQALLGAVSGKFKGLTLCLFTTCFLYILAKHELNSKIISILTVSVLLGSLCIQVGILAYWIIAIFKVAGEELVNTKETAIMQLLRKLRIVMIAFAVLIVPGIAFEIFMIIKRPNKEYKDWKFENKFYWQLLLFLLLLTIGVLMRPQKAAEEVSMSFNENAPDNSRSIGIGPEVRRNTALDISNLYKEEVVLDA